jgi:hypothetical protein
MHLGRAYNVIGNYDEAKAALNRAHALFRVLGDGTQIASVQEELAETARLQDQHRSS